MRVSACGQKYKAHVFTSRRRSLRGKQIVTGEPTPGRKTDQCKQPKQHLPQRPKRSSISVLVAVNGRFPTENVRKIRSPSSLHEAHRCMCQRPDRKPGSVDPSPAQFVLKIRTDKDNILLGVGGRHVVASLCCLCPTRWHLCRPLSFALG